jgi:hypothetical protein
VDKIMNQDKKKPEVTFSGEDCGPSGREFSTRSMQPVVRHITRLEASALRQRRPYCRHCLFSDGRHADSCVRPR